MVHRRIVLPKNNKKRGEMPIEANDVLFFLSFSFILTSQNKYSFEISANPLLGFREH